MPYVTLAFDTAAEYLMFHVLHGGWFLVTVCWRGCLNVTDLSCLTPLLNVSCCTCCRIVPDYSVLVLLSCLANPVAGAVVCALHKHAKNLYYSES